MITNKIEALKATLIGLKDPDREYEHGHHGTCNCGFVISAITELGKNEILKRLTIDGLGGCYYSDMIDGRKFEICPVTGLPMNYIIKSLFEAGFNGDDIKNLENLSDKKVLSLARINTSLNGRYYADRENVIAYITAWIEILEEEQGCRVLRHPLETTVEPEIKTVYVTIDTKVKELTTELTLN